MRLFVAPLRLMPTLVRHRFLLGQLAWRAYTARHAGSYLGWLWTPLSTVVQFVLYTVVFSAILQIKIDGLGIDLARRPDVGFGVFLITGLVPFLAINDAVLRAARVFRAHTSLVQRVRLPLEVLVVGDMLGAMLHHALSFAVVVVYCAARGHLTLAGVPWVFLGVVLCLLWIVGMGLVASVLGAFLPDVPEFLELAMQVVFYGAPLVYPLSMIHNPTLSTLVSFNPVTPLVGVVRAGLLAAAPPSATVVLAVALAGAALFALGAAAVDRWRSSIPDLL